MDNKNNEGFSYTYSAEEQAEVKKIREKYMKPTETEDKMERLRRLDSSVTQTATAVSLVLGIVGALALGLGMSICMTELADVLGLSGNAAMVWGVAIGLVGCALVGVAYPVYNAIVKRKRKKIAPEIIRITDELMK